MTVGNLVFDLFPVGQELWLRVGLGIGGVKSAVTLNDLGELSKWLQSEIDRRIEKTKGR
jgi:hypothetical protein